MPEPNDDRRTIPQQRGMLPISRAVLMSEQAKRWTKRYRTEVAASSSSLLSTLVAVRHMRDKKRIRPGKANCLSVSIGLCENANASVSINELSSIKFNAQLQSRYKFQSFTDCVRYTYKTEGVHGFWRGGFIILRCLRTFANSFTQVSGHPWQALRWSGRYPFPSTRNRNTPTMIGFTRPLAAPP